MKKIAALIDIDSRINSILESAFMLAEQHQAELVIYHFLDKEEKLTITDSKLTMNETNLTDRCKIYAVAYDVDYTIQVGTGKFKKAVNDLIKAEGIDLIVMGSNGISDLKEQVFGSHAEKVIENISCSVLIIKDIKLNKTIKDVVFASSYNEMDKEVFRYFLNFFKLPKDAMIHLLMVDTYSFFNQPTLVVKEQFEGFAKLARPYSTKKHFYHGISVEEGITRFMEEEKPDLLIMSNKYSRLIRSAFSSGSKMVATFHQNQFPFLAIDYDKKTQEA
ncbi:universal stress protein [Portibacter marinus]|uniref:universal stress protein n=1 Tax=Portibacter marinus TaxID=2898660 RepID=UPI001F2259F8|nr:universal stress protein [Portibacter marinus]